MELSKEEIEQQLKYYHTVVDEEGQKATILCLQRQQIDVINA